MSTIATRQPSPSQPRLHRERPAHVGEGLIGVIAFIALLHIAGWGALIFIVAPMRLSVGATAFGVGIGLTAYMLGVRHAFDADHIAAIDNTTRKLLQEGRRPASVGFWFSFGHSTVVFALTLVLAFGIRAVVGPVLDESSALHNITGLVGAVVSSGFLYAIAALNVVVLVDVWKVFRRLRTGRYDEAALEKHLDGRGMMNRLLGRVMKVVTEPWQMYVVGLLFGFGFDTATEIALLVLTGSGVASGAPRYAVLCLPILFAAGMSLFDTLDGSFMTVAYGWALARPARKIYYNLIVTGLSVMVALMIGTLEIVGLLGERLNLRGPVWSWVATLDLNGIGFVIVGLFVATWTVAIAIWKYGRLEERWSVAFRRPAVEGD
jgi:high-affinity nickel-transport protein